MPIPGDMKNKVALVTGAASGLGRATALTLGRAGADVCIVDLNEAGLRETATSLEELGVRAIVQQADLAKPENCAAVVAAAVTDAGRLDALCNVAGVIGLANSVDMPVAAWNLAVAVNLSAPFLLAQAAIPHLLKTEGAIVNVTSAAAFLGEAYAAAYCATKAGLAHLTKALAMEFAKTPLRINAVAPGGMATGMMHGFALPEGADMSLIQRYMPLRGLVEVEDVAEMIAYLASPAGRSYHGAVISIDNGITAG